MNTNSKITKTSTVVSWRESYSVFAKPRVIGMIFLGFAAGLPFLLVFSTLSAWLRDEGVARTTIGFFSWVGITYSIKFFWAPVVDRVPIPWLTIKLGKRRSWMLLAQIVIAAGLLGMAASDPSTELLMIAVYALVVAFGSATQDITIDAYRIEAMGDRYQGAMAATYVFGYKLALLVAGAGTLYMAQDFSWHYAYTIMAFLMIIGMITTLIIAEPEHQRNTIAEKVEKRLEATLGLDKQKSSAEGIGRWFVDAVVSPFVEFFERNGRMALIILLLIATYKLSEITMGVMAYPFYIDLGFTLKEIANVAKIFGFFMSIAGAALGGVIVVRYGIKRPLMVGAILIILTNLLFVWLAVTEKNIISLAMVISADNLSGGFATAAFIAYLSSLTNRAYTATQYALFSSLMTLPAKFMGGFSGIVVDAAGYAYFFLYAGLLGIPALLLIIYILKQQDIS
ncbi:MAG: AmpG family muropeptide MFS transporter [Proteobacteria bacterium]|nr:AmpG family muropeptide MFS transporter [Pseudomonadota bacterium]MCH8261975.1 AmpG family muropeptide MFS transporter [Pseudomonadota bacterium]